MYHGVVPDVLPLAPRPLQGELRSSWLLRVASANALTLRELMDALAARHPGAGIDDAFLDDGLPARVARALAQFARLPESVVHGLDLTDQLPGCPGAWMLRAPGLQVGGRDQVSDQRAAYAFVRRVSSPPRRWVHHRTFPSSGRAPSSRIAPSTGHVYSNGAPAVMPTIRS
jgi:hypothetical protein